MKAANLQAVHGARIQIHKRADSTSADNKIQARAPFPPACARVIWDFLADLGSVAAVRPLLPIFSQAGTTKDPQKQREKALILP